jgi:hypothetical protein
MRTNSSVHSKARAILRVSIVFSVLGVLGMSATRSAAGHLPAQAAAFPNAAAGNSSTSLTMDGNREPCHRWG